MGGELSGLKPHGEGASPRVFEPLSHVFTAVFVLVAGFVSVYPLLGRAPWMGYFEDDFFYYLKVAVNLAQGHGSTFNGLVPTNGYHPLWLIMVTLACMVSTSERWILIFLSLVVFASTVLTFVLSRRLLRPVANPLLATALAVYIAFYSMHLYVGGMEVILTIPLMLAAALVFQSDALWQPRFAPAFGFGLLLSAVFLSRLDTALLIGLLLVVVVLHPVLRVQLFKAQVAGVLAGLVPAVLYVLSNRVWFHTLLPVSGMSKQLRAHHSFAPEAWHSFLAKTPAQLVNLLPIALAIVVLPAILRRLDARRQVLYSLLLLFPFLYITVLSFLSDWQLWDWYFYSLRTALVVAFVVLLSWQPSGRLLRVPLVTALVALVCAGLMLTNKRGYGGDEMHQVGEQVAAFGAAHPGIYAMGDRSGVVGYLLPRPLVQTEGLMMDRDFLDVVKAQIPLEQALARYHVRYYVATVPGPTSAGCLHVSEPYQAGPDSPHMQATLCQPPVAEIDQHGLRTMIFDMAR